jgi:hypothetical protein
METRLFHRKWRLVWKRRSVLTRRSFSSSRRTSISTRQQESVQKLAVGAYVPSFLKITAKDIEQWVEGNLEARSHLAVLLRKLVNSTGQGLTLVDFPGYDNSQKIRMGRTY